MISVYCFNFGFKTNTWNKIFTLHHMPFYTSTSFFQCIYIPDLRPLLRYELFQIIYLQKSFPEQNLFRRKCYQKIISQREFVRICIFLYITTELKPTGSLILSSRTRLFWGPMTFDLVFSILPKVERFGWIVNGQFSSVK